jgi:NAD(P)-dependent dehydrogenase (short-subunit alcohol dehydrogenase family)
MDLELKGKSALVTGSTGGIGFAIARGLAREGARVIVSGRSDERVNRAIDTIKQKHGSAEIDGFVGDLGLAEAAAELTVRYSDVDILINNLGIFEPKPFVEITDQEWMHFFEVNVLSGVRLARFYLPRMLKKDWGRIIFISSESAVQTPAEMVHYGTTKTAQLAVSRGLAELTAGSGVTVNAILPGPTASEGVTEFVDRLSKQANQSAADFEKQFFEKMRPTSLLKRFASTEEVANLVVYVSSPAASGTNGAALRVDGGVVRSIL